MKSIFTHKSSKPTIEDLKKALGSNFDHWQTLADFTKKSYPAATEEWNFGGEKYGWNFRIKDKKRVILYLLPRDQFFKAALVFGQKATDKIMAANISEQIKTELAAAKVYAEGRGIRIEVKDKSVIPDIKKLITIKIE